MTGARISPAMPTQSWHDTKRTDARFEWFSLAAFVSVYPLLQGFLVLHRNVNWDEFFFLSQVYDFAEGRLTRSTQTFHVHMFGWLRLLSVNEVEQVIAGRMAMSIAHGATATCIFLVARRVFTSRDAWLVLIAYLSSAYVLGHAISFRTDPLAAAFMMTSLAILFCGSLRFWLAALAAAFAAAGLLVTMKSVFYLPAFAAAFAFRMHRDGRKATILHFSQAAALLVVFSLLGLSLHSSLIGGSDDQRVATVTAKSSFEKTVLSQPWFPRLHTIAIWVVRNPIAAILVLKGAIEATKALAQRRVTGLICVLLLAPVCTLAFYRNAYPYFFPFIMPPIFIGAGIALKELRGPRLRAIVIALLGIASLLQFKDLAKEDQVAQRAIIAEVHRLFPTPEPYIDRNAMIPSFPKVGFFMTGWGMENALATGRPALAPLIERSQPVFVIANTPILEAALGQEVSEQHYSLHPIDMAALRENYIHHWGPIWVAGKRFEGIGSKFVTDIAIAGEYTIECTGKRVLIEGQSKPCGGHTWLEPGQYHLAMENNRVVSLRWGHNLPISRETAPTSPIYYGL
jgi:hypothetical protein